MSMAVWVSAPPSAEPPSSTRLLGSGHPRSLLNRDRSVFVLASSCHTSSSWQVFRFGKVGDEGGGVVEVNVVGAVPGECLVGADGVVVAPVVLGVADQVEGVGDLLEGQLLVLQGAETAFA